MNVSICEILGCLILKVTIYQKRNIRTFFSQIDNLKFKLKISWKQNRLLMHVFNHKIQFKMFSEEHMVKYIRISLRHPFSVYIFTNARISVRLCSTVILCVEIIHLK